MRFGVPAKTRGGETCVAMTPETAQMLEDMLKAIE